jgi:hypothetical protein
MSVSAAAILAVLVAFPQSRYVAEDRYAFELRAETMAEAVASEARSVEEAAAVAVIWEREGGLDPLIHAGLPHPVLTSDHGRARCLGQVHSSGLVPRQEWATLAGTDLDATTRCAWATLRVLRSMAGMCTGGQMLDRDGMARVFAAYGGTGCAPTVQSVFRAREWVTIRSKLWAGTK